MKKQKLFIALILLFLLSIRAITILPSRGTQMAELSRSFDLPYDRLYDPETRRIPYILPTDVSNRITSYFAEHRTNHFHAGIDFSTNGITGHKVFAVRDGYLYRIRVTPDGYGKKLYIKHDDGYVSTYAHLERFNNLIDSLTQAEQYSRGTYSVDITFEDPIIKFRQGELIAYTGATGVGPPHLHFEILDENLNPVNPFLFDSYLFEDNSPPRIKQLMVVPLDQFSTVDYSTDPKIIRKFFGNPRSLAVSQSIKITGNIGLSIEAQDYATSNSNKTGINSMQLLIEDSMYFTAHFDRIKRDATKQINLHYDVPALRSGKGKFQKLYLEPGNTLQFYKGRNGIISAKNLPEGKYNFRIICTDNAENHSELKGTLIVQHKPEIQNIELFSNKIKITTSNPNCIKKCIISSKKLYDQQWVRHTFQREKFNLDSNIIELPIDKTYYDVLKVEAESHTGCLSAPYYHFLKKPHGKIQPVSVDITPMRDYVKIILTSPGIFTEPPVITIYEGHNNHKLTTEAIDLNKYISFHTPSYSITGQREITVNAEINGNDVTVTNSFELFPIKSDAPGSFKIGENDLSIFYDSGAVFRPLLLRYSKLKQNGLIIHSLEPKDVLLNKGISVSIPCNNYSTESNIGLYYRLNHGWHFLTCTPDSSNKYFRTTLTRFLGEIALLKDTEPPTIGKLNIRLSKNNQLIKFRYHDNLSGVNTDKIKIYINNNLLIPEIDNEHQIVHYESKKTLALGKYHLKILVEDMMKNVTEINREIKIKPTTKSSRRK